MSKKEPVILPGNAAPALYSPAVRIEHTLYVSGQVGEDTQGCVPDGIEAQTALAIENAAKLIEAAGATLTDVLMCRCFLQKKEDFAGMNAAYSRYFGGEKNIAPARYTVIAPPVDEKYLVEIAMIVAL